MTFEFLVVARWIHFAAVFALFGASFFWFYMSGKGSAVAPAALPRTYRATVRLLQAAAPVAAVSGVAWLAGMLINMTSDAGSVIDPETLGLFFFETPFGTVAILRLALLGLAIFVVALPSTGRAWLSALLHIGALLLISQAWLGHAAEGGAGLYGAAMIIAYAVHVLAAATWVGGLPPLLFAVREIRRPPAERARIRTLDLLSRYSFTAIAAVSLIVLTGVVNAGFRVAGSFDKLFDTSYGDALVVKLAVVALMLTLASYNRFVAMPRLRASSPDDVARVRKVGYSVASELALGACVLAASAVLGLTMPPQ